MTDLNPDQIWRGNPPSSDHQPNPIEIVDYINFLLQFASAGLTAIRSTKAELDLVSGTDGDFAKVTNDGANSGYYTYSGGAWGDRVDLEPFPLPADLTRALAGDVGVMALTVTDATNPDLLIADYINPDLAGRSPEIGDRFTIEVIAPNTVGIPVIRVAGTDLDIRHVDGSDLPIGYWDNRTYMFRMTSSGGARLCFDPLSSDELAAQIQAAADAAEASAQAFANTAETNATVASVMALTVVDDTNPDAVIADYADPILSGRLPVAGDHFRITLTNANTINLPEIIISGRNIRIRDTDGTTLPVGYWSNKNYYFRVTSNNAGRLIFDPQSITERGAQINAAATTAADAAEAAAIAQAQSFADTAEFNAIVANVMALNVADDTNPDLVIADYADAALAGRLPVVGDNYRITLVTPNTIDLPVISIAGRSITVRDVDGENLPVGYWDDRTYYLRITSTNGARLAFNPRSLLEIDNQITTAADAAELNATTAAQGFADAAEAAAITQAGVLANAAEADAITQAGVLADAAEAAAIAQAGVLADAAESNATTAAQGFADAAEADAITQAGVLADAAEANATTAAQGFANTAEANAIVQATTLANAAEVSATAAGQAAATSAGQTAIAAGQAAADAAEAAAIAQATTLASTAETNATAAAQGFADTAEADAIAQAGVLADAAEANAIAQAGTLADAAEADAIAQATILADAAEANAITQAGVLADAAEANAITQAGVLADAAEANATTAAQGFADTAEANAIAGIQAAADTAEANAINYHDAVTLADGTVATLSNVALTEHFMTVGSDGVTMQPSRQTIDRIVYMANDLIADAKTSPLAITVDENGDYTGTLIGVRSDGLLLNISGESGAKAAGNALTTAPDTALVSTGVDTFLHSYGHGVYGPAVIDRNEIRAVANDVIVWFNLGESIAADGYSDSDFLVDLERPLSRVPLREAVWMLNDQNPVQGTGGTNSYRNNATQIVVGEHDVVPMDFARDTFSRLAIGASRLALDLAKQNDLSAVIARGFSAPGQKLVGDTDAANDGIWQNSLREETTQWQNFITDTTEIFRIIAAKGLTVRAIIGEFTAGVNDSTTPASEYLQDLQGILAAADTHIATLSSVPITWFVDQAAGPQNGNNYPNRTVLADLQTARPDVKISQPLYPIPYAKEADGNFDPTHFGGGNLQIGEISALAARREIYIKENGLTNSRGWFPPYIASAVASGNGIDVTIDSETRIVVDNFALPTQDDFLGFGLTGGASITAVRQTGQRTFRIDTDADPTGNLLQYAYRNTSGLPLTGASNCGGVLREEWAERSEFGDGIQLYRWVLGTEITVT